MFIKINIQMREWEGKQNSFLVSFNNYSDGFVDMKKDVYSQLYDSNLTINNKFQVITDTYIDKFKKSEIDLVNFKQNITVTSLIKSPNLNTNRMNLITFPAT